MKKFILCSVLLGTAVCHGANVTEWRGPGRTGIFAETGLLKEWPEGGPKAIWSVEDLGVGYSSVVVVDGKIYTTGNGSEDNAGKELLYALDKDGKHLWSVVYGGSWKGTEAADRDFPPARTTPTFVDGKFYVVSGAGDVACVSLDGKVEWTTSIPSEFKGRHGAWGWSVSPLVHDGKVMFTVSSAEGVFAALDAKTGKKAWLSAPLDGNAAFVSPALIERKGKKQAVGQNGNFIFGVNPADGKIEWQAALAEVPKFGEGGPARDINCVTPVLADDILVASTGYGVGTYAYKLNDSLTSAELIWVNRDVPVQLGGILTSDGLVWAAGDKNQLAGMDTKTGEVKASEGWGKGAIVAADGMLYSYTEKGKVGLFEMNKDNPAKKGEFPVTKGSLQHWAHPVIAGGILFIRHGNALMAYDVKK